MITSRWVKSKVEAISRLTNAELLDYAIETLQISDGAEDKAFIAAELCLEELRHRLRRWLKKGK